MVESDVKIVTRNNIEELVQLTTHRDATNTERRKSFYFLYCNKQMAFPESIFFNIILSIVELVYKVYIFSGMYEDMFN
jgi:hypothetical protein